MEDLALIFKALGDGTRLRLATLLALRGETCVCELAAALDEPEAKISRHLGVMRAAGLVAARRQGTWMHYQLCTESVPLIHCLGGCLISTIAETTTIQEDLERLEQAACAINKPT